MPFPCASGQVTICKATKQTNKNRSCKCGLEGENYFLRVLIERDREREKKKKKTWKLMSCEMIAMEGDILKCSKICIFALVSRVMKKH